jgi:BirA family biotin operon repressor/biotin-[acetyl-CoA-carboxylase] ligase
MSARPANQTAFDWTCDWARAKGVSLWSAIETDSTNRVAKDDLSRVSPTLYVAARQTAGRGRGSHTWLAVEGASLLSSWAFALSSPPQPVLSPLVGLALFESAREVWPGLPLNLKAPNDLYLGKKKLAGLLIETVTQGRDVKCVVGLGLNTHAAPDELSTAASLADHLGAALAREAWHGFLETWLTRLEQALLDGQETSLSAAHCERLKDALNLHPLLAEPLLNVDSLGQLHFPSRKVYWYEL